MYVSKHSWAVVMFFLIFFGSTLTVCIQVFIFSLSHVLLCSVTPLCGGPHEST